MKKYDNCIHADNKKKFNEIQWKSIKARLAVCGSKHFIGEKEKSGGKRIIKSLL